MYCSCFGSISVSALPTSAYIRTLSAHGCLVYEFSRRDRQGEGLVHVGCDVTDEKQVQEAVRQVTDAEGRIDIVVNCAGFGISGAVEYTATADAVRQMDVNFFGLVRVNRAVLPVMHAQGSGRIVNISSVAAPASIPFQAYYSASKAAINDYTQALANEVRPYGITVCAVMPGDIRSGFTEARSKSCEGDDVYGGRIARSVAVMEKDEQNGMAPEAAARTIVKVALKKGRVKPCYAIGFSYKFLVLLDSLLPCRTVRWLLGILYGK